MAGDRAYTVADVAKHNKADDCWIIVDGGVYDVTKFLSEHPGGKKVIVAVAGQDASKKFHLFHKPSVMQKYGPGLKIGTVSGGAGGAVAAGKSSSQAAAAPSSPPTKSTPSASTSKPSSPKSSASDSPSSASSKSVPRPLSDKQFGELVPYGDPNWYQGWHSPYYKPHHHKLRAAIRSFVDTEIMPNCHEWDEEKQLPRTLFTRMADAGVLQGVCGPPWPTAIAGRSPAGDIKPEEFDVWCELISIDEIARCGSGGVVWGLFGGLSIGLPPVSHFASDELKKRIVGPCLRGEKVICLAITEPYAGSDVANIQCEAKLSDDGKHYIVNGEKKWITNGVFADFFTVAVRTGGKGMKGISLLLIERSEGVTTRQMACQGVWSSGTTYITFEDVKVPVGNLIGKENEGFKYIVRTTLTTHSTHITTATFTLRSQPHASTDCSPLLADSFTSLFVCRVLNQMMNFNHERWSICAQSCRFARVCLEEAMRYSFKRRTFGKLLIEHPVIRLKLAHMARQVEATWSWIESITHQMSVMDYREQARELGGAIALCKAQSTTVFEYCAREASQIFGGLSYTRGGQGEKVERLYREVRAFAIPGGSEEIMLDLGVRMAVKPYAMREMARQKKADSNL